MNYAALSQPFHAEAVSASWSIVIADVRGSTALMKSGRQSDVNLVGAACIAAVRNLYPTRSVPYVFGGDGATFLVGPENLAGVMRALKQVRASSRKNFGIELRVDAISVAELYERGAKLSLGFIEAGEKECLPYFRGTAIALADRLIKDLWREEERKTQVDTLDSPDLSGLGCYHEPFASLRGKVLSIIIEFREDAEEDEALRAIFDTLMEDGPLDRLRPVQKQNLKRQTKGAGWRPGPEGQASSLSIGLHELASRLRLGVGKLIFHLDVFGMATGISSAYTESLIQQSDWIKMDGALRMVLDVNAAEEAKLQAVLERCQRAVIYFGSYASDSALMTCHIKSRKGQQHTHFIDGADGGLTYAALQLKEQKRVDLPVSA